MTNPDPMSQMKTLSRQRLRQLWQTAQIGGELNDEDRRTAAAMAEHPGYTHLWPRLDQLTDAEITADGADPIMHIILHATVENQIAMGDPPEVGQTLAALEQRGLPRHEAVHRVASVLVNEIRHILRENRPHDSARYAAGLAALLRTQSTPSRPSAGSTRRKPKRKR